jgi:uncharacterized protein YndB with AHSA1/START domain
VIEPLRLSFEVACPVAHAFEVWTARIGTWWPADHTVTGDPASAVILEPGVGGRVYERTPSGEVHDWGEITAWEPPHRLAYLWHLRRDRADATEVEITFTPHDGATTVEIEHRGWDRLGARGSDWRTANLGGWTTLLPHYQASAGA